MPICTCLHWPITLSELAGDYIGFTGNGLVGSGLLESTISLVTIISVFRQLVRERIDK